MGNIANSTAENNYEYTLSSELNTDMQELNKEVKNSKNKNIFSRSANYMMAITAALTMVSTTPAASQTKDKIPESKNMSLSTLDLLMKDVNSYYPGMEVYAKSLINGIPTKEWEDAVIKILQETVWKAVDKKQRIGGTIYAIE